MIISEESEAEEYGITATKHEILKSNTIMFEHLRWLLDEGITLCEIPQRIKTWIMKELLYLCLTITISITYNKKRGYASNKT